MLERLRRDIRRTIALESQDGYCPLLRKVRIALTTAPLFAVAVHRFGHWIYTSVPFRPARLPLTVVYHLLDQTARVLWGMHISPAADIGAGLYVDHAGFLLVGPVTMGQDCSLGPNTIIGQRSSGEHGTRVPTIGDRVWIGAGSVVFGNISVGSGATIGPLTLVGRNVASGSLVLGSPMQVLKKNHDNTRQIYGAAGPLPE